jgi:Zn2+/Cd2+-exporting ATPase
VWAEATWVASYIAGGIGPTVNAFQRLRNGELSVDLLMIVAALGAATIGEPLEGAVLLFLFSLSGSLESYAMNRTKRSIESLMKLRPNEAWLAIEDGADRRVAVESLQIDDVVRVKPGERFPVDGIVLEGETWADESTLTGESLPITKRMNSRVYAGTINGQGSITVRMTKAPADSTIQRIIALVQSAQAQKTPAQRLVESWQKPYVIGVFTAALAVLLAAHYIHGDNWHDSSYHAMVMLVAASPCAVVVSSPAAMLSAIARAGRQGILFKGALHIEALAQVDVIAFDKTGTLTTGQPEVRETWTPDAAVADRLLALAATVEARSEHPLAKPIVEEALRRGVDVLFPSVADFHSHTGLGVHARVDGVWVGVGREGLFASHDVQLPVILTEQAQHQRQSGQTALLATTDREGLFGSFGVADRVRPEAAQAIGTLKRLGVREVVMLTGDHERVGQAIAAELGIDRVHSGLLPEQKVNEVQRMILQDQRVAMVGDGVNDAPALAAATVGVAMGGAGSDVALEVADIVLMADDLHALPQAVAISRLAYRRVRQNFTIAFSMIALLVLATFFNLPLWLGVVGHEGSTVVVVFNGLRLLWQPVDAG